MLILRHFRQGIHHCTVETTPVVGTSTTPSRQGNAHSFSASFLFHSTTCILQKPAPLSRRQKVYNPGRSGGEADEQQNGTTTSRQKNVNGNEPCVNKRTATHQRC